MLVIDVLSNYHIVSILRMIVLGFILPLFYTPNDAQLLKKMHAINNRQKNEILRTFITPNTCVSINQFILQCGHVNNCTQKTIENVEKKIASRVKCHQANDRAVRKTHAKDSSTRKVKPQVKFSYFVGFIVFRVLFLHATVTYICLI